MNRGCMLTTKAPATKRKPFSLGHPSRKAVEAVTKPARVRRSASPTDPPGDDTRVVDEFRYQGGERILTAIVMDGKLLLRAQTIEGAAVAINLDATGAHRMGITLAKFLQEKNLI